MSPSRFILAFLALLFTPILAAPLPPPTTLVQRTDSLCSDSTISWDTKFEEGCEICNDKKSLPADVYVKYCLKFTPAIVLPPVKEVWRRNAIDARDEIVHTPTTEIYVATNKIPLHPKARDVPPSSDSSQSSAPPPSSNSATPPSANSENEGLLQHSTPPTASINDNTVLKPAPGIYRRGVELRSEKHTMPPLQSIQLGPATGVWNDPGSEA